MNDLRPQHIGCEAHYATKLYKKSGMSGGCLGAAWGWGKALPIHGCCSLMSDSGSQLQPRRQRQHALSSSPCRASQLFVADSPLNHKMSLSEAKSMLNTWNIYPYINSCCSCKWKVIELQTIGIKCKQII